MNTALVAVRREEFKCPFTGVTDTSSHLCCQLPEAQPPPHVLPPYSLTVDGRRGGEEEVGGEGGRRRWEEKVGGGGGEEEVGGGGGRRRWEGEGGRRR